MRYDAIVVGSGPAGLQAAINLKIRNKSFLLFGHKNLSGKIEAAPKIDNYLGLPGISGRELHDRFAEHLRHMDIAVTAEQVVTIYPMGDYFAVATNRGAYEAASVILAAGAAPKGLLPGEERLLGKGVGYCATCDAPLYRGKRVVVVGWSEEAVLEANFISELAETVLYIPAGTGHDLSALHGGVQIIEGPALEITGSDKVDGVRTKQGKIEADGVFLLRETIAPDSLVPGLAVKDRFVQVDSEMRTNIPGCFAAGDCTGKPHQYMRAAGQGQVAALAAAVYLDLQKRERRD